MNRNNKTQTHFSYFPFDSTTLSDSLTAEEIWQFQKKIQFTLVSAILLHAMFSFNETLQDMQKEKEEKKNCQEKK